MTDVRFNVGNSHAGNPRFGGFNHDAGRMGDVTCETFEAVNALNNRYGSPGTGASRKRGKNQIKERELTAEDYGYKNFRLMDTRGQSKARLYKANGGKDTMMLTARPKDKGESISTQVPDKTDFLDYFIEQNGGQVVAHPNARRGQHHDVSSYFVTGDDLTFLLQEAKPGVNTDVLLRDSNDSHFQLNLKAMPLQQSNLVLRKLQDCDVIVKDDRARGRILVEPGVKNSRVFIEQVTTVPGSDKKPVSASIALPGKETDWERETTKEGNNKFTRFTRKPDNKNDDKLVVDVQYPVSARVNEPEPEFYGANPTRLLVDND